MTEYTELEGSPRLDLTYDGTLSVSRELKCDWGLALTLCYELMGQPYGGSGLGQACYCVKTSMRPHPGKVVGYGSYATYEYAIVTATYETMDVDNETFISESMEPSAEFLTVPPDGLVWSLDDEALTQEEAPGFLCRGYDWILTIHKVQNIPTAILGLIGCTNSTVLFPRTPGMSVLSFAPETLLFTPPTMSRTLDLEGNWAWTLTYRLSYKPNWDRSAGVARGWNWFWRNKTQRWEQIKIEDGGSIYKQYPPADLNVLGIFA